jgi:hypothetical protein
MKPPRSLIERPRTNKAKELMVQFTPFTSEHWIDDNFVPERGELDAEEPFHKVVRVAKKGRVHARGI